jgi:TldD protein
MWWWTFVALAGAPSGLEAVLAEEQARAWQVLAARPEPPHYLALAVRDTTSLHLAASMGVVSRTQRAVTRDLDVDLRVGTPELDSRHALRGFSALASERERDTAAPQGEGWALRRALWREIDAEYRMGAERIVMLRASQQVRNAEEDPAPDFQPGPPRIARLDVADRPLDEAAWSATLVALSARLDASASVVSSEASLVRERSVTTFVDSEGSRVVTGGTRIRLALAAEGIAADGDPVEVQRLIDVHDPGHLPSTEVLAGWATAVVDDLVALRAAPRGEPYSGPVLLRGRAAGVFVHEVLGHRVEGHRQKDDEEGKTFRDAVGDRILPPWLDIYDDPTVAQAAGADLNGHYAYDDEGMPAQRATLVEDGVFRGFLMGRSPIRDVPDSNGHARRSPGNAPTPRMGNTFVVAAAGSPDPALRQQLLAEVRAQQLPYGYVVDEIDGGFTQTGRITPNAFNVRVSSLWRVYADGRPDERVRGIDLVGTPFVAFGSVIAAGDQPEVFNGVCGAESGWVPVSAVAPSLLFRKLEFQLKERGEDRPPLLPKPGVDGAVDAEEAR